MEKIEKLLNDIIDTEEMVLKGEFNDKIYDYCYEHSSKGHDSEFSFIPLDLTYQIAVDTAAILIDYIKKKELNYGKTV
jgi:hypothetical protein